MVVSEAEGIRLSNPENKVTGVVHRESMFVVLMKKILNFASVFEKKHNKTLLSTHIVYIVKNMMRSEILTETSTWSSYQCYLVAKIMLDHSSVLPHVKSLNTEDAGSKSMSISTMDDIGVHTATMEELPIITRVTSNFANNQNRPYLFHAPVFYSSTKIFLKEQGAMFVDHRTDLASLFDLLSTPITHTPTTGIFLLHIFFSCMGLYFYDQKNRNGA